MMITMGMKVTCHQHVDEIMASQDWIPKYYPLLLPPLLLNLVFLEVYLGAGEAVSCCLGRIEMRIEEMKTR